MTELWYLLGGIVSAYLLWCFLEMWAASHAEKKEWKKHVAQIRQLNLQPREKGKHK